MAGTKDPKATYIDYSARAWSTTADGIFAEAGQILDRARNKDQQAINDELYRNIGSAVAGLYVFKGSKTLTELKALTGVKKGDVYNITDENFALNGKKYTAGTNVAATEDMASWKETGWDALGGTVDMESINAKIKTATDTANTASSNASTAIQTANTASGKADAASQKAATAESTANAAKTTAEQAEGTATAAQNAATDAVNKAHAAQTTATEANKTAGQAKTTAESAEKLANNALLIFDGVVESATVKLNSTSSITAIKWVKSEGKFAGVGNDGQYYATWVNTKRPSEIYGLFPRNVVYFNNVDKKLYVINSAGSLVSVSEIASAGDTASTDKALSVKATHDLVSTKADKEHEHLMANITGLTAALADKAEKSHKHAPAEITGLTTMLAQYVTNTTFQELVTRVGKLEGLLKLA